MKTRKIVALLLVALLTLACMLPACAEDAEDAATDDIRLTDVKIGSKVYSFDAPLEAFEAQGITITASELKPDYWLSANDGRASFDVLVSGTKGDPDVLSVCGVRVRPDGNQTFELYGGIVIGPEPCTKEQIHAAYGESTNNWYNFRRKKVQYRVYYNDDDTVREIQILSSFPMAYGFEYSDLAGVADENLPDPKAMGFDEYILDGKHYKGQITLQDLVDDGWLLDASIDLNQEVEPQGAAAFFISNPFIVCFNGKSTLQVFPINRSVDTACKLSECGVLYVGANEADDVDVVLANGITLGTPYEDVVALFGEATRTEDHSDDGYMVYDHTVMDTVTYTFSVSDGLVKYISIQP